VALTFDDGPDPAVTPKILQHLDRRGVKATFFVVGKHVAYYPGHVRELHRRGHAIGNHTYDHPRLPRIATDDAVRAQFALTSAAIAGEDVPRPRIWRPPFKAVDRRIRALAGDMKVALWGVDAEDNRTNRGDPRGVVRTVMARVFDGAIVLLHDDHDPTALRALPGLIDALSERGYCFGTLSPSPRWNDRGVGQGNVEIAGARAAGVRR
jgi:peptidoglycan/xylan/chitin deacetylase (PgdA/CDA1 family)